MLMTVIGAFGALRELPQAVVASPEDVLHLIDANTLGGLGIGYVDAHLLAATLLTNDAKLWTRDKRLAAVASGLGVALHVGRA